MEIDTIYSLKLLRKVNNLQVGSKSMGEYFMQGTHSLWSFQQFFLLAQIKDFSQYKDADAWRNATTKAGARIGVRVRVFLMNMFMFTISLLALLKMVLFKPRVVLFCSDILKPGTRFNPRITNVYRALTRAGSSSIEIVHTVGGKKLFSNFFILRRLVFYSESINALYNLLPDRKNVDRDSEIVANISLDTFDDTEKEFVRELLSRTFENIRISRFKTLFLRRILSSGGARAFITIDDVRHTNEIISACKDAGVTSYIFQHSNFDYLVGLDELPVQEYIFPDVFFVWNNYWYKRLPEVSPLYAHYKERIKIGGRAYSFTPGACALSERKEEYGESLRVLVPSEVNVTTSQVRPYMKALLQYPSVKLSFLVRGDYDREEQIGKYFVSSDRSNPNLTIVEPQDKVAAHTSTHVVLGVYSGFLDESIEMCKPVGVMHTDYPILNKLHTDNLASLIDSEAGDLLAQLEAVRMIPHEVLTERRSRFMAGTGDAEATTFEILER